MGNPSASWYRIVLSGFLMSGISAVGGYGLMKAGLKFNFLVSVSSSMILYLTTSMIGENLLQRAGYYKLLQAKEADVLLGTRRIALEEKIFKWTSLALLGNLFISILFGVLTPLLFSSR